MKELTLKHIQRGMRKARKKQAAEFHPYTVSLKRWCESYGVPKHFDWLRSLILRDLEENESLGDYIRFGADFYDVHLDHNGVFIFSDTLQDFFGSEQVRSMHRYLRNRNELARLRYGTEKTIRSFTDEQLTEYAELWDGQDIGGYEDDVKELVQSISDLIHIEQRRRSKRFRLPYKKKMPTGGNR